MDAATLQHIVDLVSRGGLLAVFLLVLVTGYKQVWVWGHHHRQIIEDRDSYRKQLFEKIAAMEALLLQKTMEQRAAER